MYVLSLPNGEIYVTEFVLHYQLAREFYGSRAKPLLTLM